MTVTVYPSKMYIVTYGNGGFIAKTGKELIKDFQRRDEIVKEYGRVPDYMEIVGVQHRADLEICG